MSIFAYYNGKFDSTNNITIPLSDRSIFFGDGVYDAAVGHDGKIYLENEHITRLFRNLKKVGIETDLSKNDISEILHRLIERTKIKEYFLYFHISRNYAKRTHSALECDHPNILVTIDTFSPPDIKKTISLMTVEDLRYFYCDIKTLNLLPSVMASTTAESNGCTEAVFHRGSTITECAHSNIAILKDGILKTHPANNLILPGITRKRMLRACNELGIEYVEKPFTTTELFSADEIIVSSTSKLCVRATSVNGITVGGADNENAKRICKWMRNDYCMLSE